MLSVLLLALVLSVHFEVSGLNQCTAANGINWITNPPVRPATQLPDGRLQVVPDQCAPAWEPFDGRCYAYSLGLFGVPKVTTPLYANAGGNPPQANWATAESICANPEYAADAFYGGSHLASVHTLREDCFLYELIKGHPYYHATGGVCVNNVNNPKLCNDSRSYNNREGCHSNNRGQASTPDQQGTCWIGLDQKSGAADGSLSYGWNDFTVYDKRPSRNQGFTPWAGDSRSSACWDPATGSMITPCAYSFEPNNIAGGTEDCTQIWDRDGTRGEWNDEPCSLQYPYFCAKLARCRAGYFRSQLYRGMPVRVNISIIDLGVDSRLYSTGMCTQCAAGTWHPQDSTANYESQCFPCPAGRYGYIGETQGQCRNRCPPGSYCEPGTGNNTLSPCPAGTYNSDYGKSSIADCSTTPAGSYSLVNATAPIPCSAGKCSGERDAVPGCSTLCPAGYYCPTSNTTGTRCFDVVLTVSTSAQPPQPCNRSTQWSSSGQSSCNTVLAGYYTVGGSETTRTGQEQCPVGTFCVAGEKNLCAAGKYNDRVGSTSSSDCKDCSAGYYCPPGSSSPTQEPCFLGSPSPNALNFPKMYYCPAGTSSRLVVSNNYYTIPANDNAANTRTDQVACTSEQVCIQGVAYPKITWNGTSCAGLSVDENNLTPATGRTLVGQLHPSLVGYNVTYRLVRFALANDLLSALSNTACDPESNPPPYSNAGIFAVDNITGAVTLTRTTYPYYLNYEPTDSNGVKCSSASARYDLTVRATAVDQSTTTNIECTIRVTVNDRNDQPKWLPEVGQMVYYRAIPERSPINTAVQRCTSDTATTYGCPVVHPNGMAVELGAVDEDYFSVLRYSFVLGVGSATNYASEADNPFRINSCSGLIQTRGDRQVSFLETRTFNFTVRVKDDGNGGQFTERTADIIVILYVTDAPDPPVLADPSLYNFTVLENQPLDQLIGRVTAFDPDLNSVISYRLKLPVEGDAFYMDSNFDIRTTSTGAKDIDFESTKTVYTLGVEAFDCTPSCPGLTDTKSYTVRVLNTNDPPRFVDVSPFYILENSADGSAVCASSSGSCPTPGPLDRVQTFDVDGAPITPGDITDYSIVESNSPFVIESSTGIIRTKSGTRSLLNFEDENLSVDAGTGRRLTVTVRATSSGNGSPAFLDQTYTVYLVDENEDPIITNVPRFYVLESAPAGSACDSDNATFPALTAVDPDNADQFLRTVLAPVQSVTFSRVSNVFHPTLNDSGTLFNIFNLASGGAAVEVVGALDFEKAPIGGLACGTGSTASSRCYIIRVRATDNGPPQAKFSETWVTIRMVDVNDGPAFADPLNRVVQVSEGLPVLSVQIPPTYAAVDQDTGNLSYTIASGTGQAYFDLVSGCSGACFAVYKKAGVTFDFESSQTTFSLDVQVSDLGSSKFIGQGCGLVNNVPAGCDAGTRCVQKVGPFRTELRCYEFCRPTVNATIIPRRDTYFCDYSALAPGYQEPIGLPFQQFGDQPLRLRFDVTDWNDPPYIVGDDGLANGQSCFINSSVTFNRQNSIQIALAKLQAQDVDVTYASTPFTFLPSNPADSFWQTFTMDSTTGRIGIYPNISGNFNTDKFLTLGQYFTANVTVFDKFPHTPVAPRGFSNCTIGVIVIAANTRPNLTDPAPINVLEGTSLNTIILPSFAPTLAIIDPDVDDNPADSLTFSMSVSPFFALDAGFGAIALQGAVLDYEQRNQHVLVVRVQDTRGADDVATVTVNVIDVNEAPNWPQGSIAISLAENTASGFLVADFRLLAVDPDTSANGVTTFKNTSFSILSGCSGSSCPFQLATPSTNGSLIVKAGASLNFEASPNQWTFVVRATDGGNPALFSDATITVRLTDENERPNIVSGLQFSVAEGSSGTFLTDLASLVSDPDATDPINALQINITAGDPSGTFIIDQAKLFVSPTGVLDFENIRQYDLNITVRDTLGLSSTGSFRVFVTNINDVGISGVSVLSNTLLNCNAITRISITGTNFGLVSRSPAATVNVTYRRAVSTDDPNPPVRFATNCSVAGSSNTEVQCDMPAGAGSNFLFNVTIAVPGLITGDTKADVASSIRYDLPTITNVVGANSLPTSGGVSAVTISGTCFGSTADQVSFAASMSSSLEFCEYIQCHAISNCTVTSPTQIVCANAIPAGLGANLRWRLRILGQQQLAQWTQGAYARPTLTSSSVTLIPTNGLPASPFFDIIGTNFGPMGYLPDQVFLTYASAVYQLRECAVTVAFVRMVCRFSDPGVGINMNMYVSFGGQLSNASPFTLNFARATVDVISGQGAQDASTLGGQFVTLTGTNFGPICGVPGASLDAGGINCQFVSATYKRGSVSVSTGLPIVYTAFPCAVVSQAQVVCATAPGTGAGHVWSVVVGGQNATVSPTAGTTAYAAPVVATYDGDGARLAKTNGGQSINIQGSNFGPVGGAPVTGRYGNKDINPTEFTSPNCAVTTAHTIITCSLSPGAGNELSWVVVVDGILGRNELTNYGVPLLASSDFVAPYLDNDGNNSIVITGLNFGPPGAPGPYLESAGFGPASFPRAYTAACTVTSHSTINCLLGPGSGNNLRMVVTIKGQTSALSTFSLSYQPPDVSGGLLPLNAERRTEGGGSLFIRGRGYSLCDPKSSVRILWNEDPSVTGATNRALDITGTMDSSGTIASPTCPIGLYSQVKFALPEMNVARKVRAYIQITSAAFGATITSSDFIDFVYDPPVLSSIFAEASAITFGGVRVSMFGLNFCKAETCCRTHLDNIPLAPESVVSHSHNRIILELTRPGSLFVRCGNVSSNALAFTTNSPFIFGTVPQLSQVEFAPLGNQTFEIWGLYFGDSTPNVTLAENISLAIVSHGVADCYDLLRPATADSFAFDSGAQCYKTVVRTPALTGRNLPIVVVRGATRSLADDVRFEFLNYRLPSIAAIGGSAIGVLLPSSGGGADLVISGSFFGAQQGTVVIGDPNNDPVICTITQWFDNEVRCTVQAGEGVDLPITIVQATGGQVTADVSLNIDFLAPVNLNFNATRVYGTEGGAIFELSGDNFGRLNKAVVTIGGRVCTRLFSNSTYVRCLVPEGEGINLPVVISVGGQAATAAMGASYAPPSILYVTPSVGLPTAGNILFTVVGSNFGIDQLILRFDAFEMAKRDLDPQHFKNPFIYPGTNHTHLQILLPEFFGATRRVTVSVSNQLSKSNVTISFAAPTLGGVSVVDENGITSPPFFTSQDLIFPVQAFNLTGVGLPAISVAARRRMRMLAEQGYGMWVSKAFGPCESTFRAQSLFWRSFAEIAPNGEFRRTFNHFADGQCSNQANQTFVVRVEGKLTDLGAFSSNLPTSACGLSRLVSEFTGSVTVTILTASTLENFFARCRCVNTWQIGVPISVPQTCLSSKSECPLLSPLYGEDYAPGVTRVGVYVIADDRDIFMSKTSASQAALESRTSIKFPDEPTASVRSEVSNLVSSIPKGPTDGCYTWESIRDYLERAEGITKRLGTPQSQIPRICFRRALLEISGTNFGKPLTPEQRTSAPANEPPSLRVFLVPDDPTVDPYEASTVASPGSHKTLCPEPDCYQTHTRIRFWIPYGLGKSLRIRVFVGDQQQDATTRFSYLPPKLDEMNPGTVRSGRKFQNARGEKVLVRGFNFGGRATTSNVLISGRPCANPVWESGSSLDADGRPFITCEAPLDVVGPKSVMICVAGQLSVSKLYRSDGAVLITGEAQDAWNNSRPFNPLFSNLLLSKSLSRCPTSTTGRLYELCVDCPPGASCEDGSFSGPKSDKFFFDYEVPTKNPDGTPTDRAKQLCTVESWNDTLLNEYPDLVQRPSCNAFVGCEPREACLGNSLCNEGYTYAQPRCLIKRGYGNTTLFLGVTRAQVQETSNSCNVTLNPYTFEYEGVDSDCTGGLSAGQTCGADNPENCARCRVFKDGVNSYFGACECTLPARCSLCTIRTHFRLNNECVPCPENPGLLIGGLFLVAIAVSILGWYLQREQVNLAFITIGVDYFQVLAIFATTKIPWPPVLQSLFNIMSVFNFNIDITAPECISPNLDYEVKWWLQMAFPLVLFTVLSFVYVTYAGYKMMRWGMFQAHVYQSHLSALIAVFMVAMYYLYLVLTKKALEIFNCNPVDPDDGFLYTAFTSLQCDGGGLCRCGEPNGPQVRLTPWAILFLVLYTFGYPLYIAIVLRRNTLLVREDQYLRAYNVGYVRKTNPDCYDLRKRYSKLYYQFKPRYASFWILVLLVRKFWIAMAFILFRGNPAFQLAVVLLVLFVSIVFQVLWRPFLSTGDKVGIARELDAMAERSIKEPAFAEYREIQRRVQEVMTLDVEHRRRKKQNKQGLQLFSNFTEDSGKNLGMTLVEKPQKVSRSVAAARWFTNLNTLEFILLGCGILICLAGIMFEASARDNRALVRAQVDAITWIVVIVVVFSLVYYFSFFVAEVAPTAMSSLISLCRRKKDEDKGDYYDPNINLEENPMFAAPKVEFADNRVLQAELDQQLSQLKLAEQQNKRLRDELKTKKMEAQLDETARQKNTGLEEVKPSKQRKDFAQTRLTAALVGPNRQRARGTGARKVQDDEEEEEGGDDNVGTAGERKSVFSRMSIAFKRPPRTMPTGDDE